LYVLLHFVYFKIKACWQSSCHYSHSTISASVNCLSHPREQPTNSQENVGVPIHADTKVGTMACVRWGHLEKSEEHKSERQSTLLSGHVRLCKNATFSKLPRACFLLRKSKWVFTPCWALSSLNEMGKENNLECCLAYRKHSITLPIITGDFMYIYKQMFFMIIK
jgi:hypothetical protein